jgi:hypothetical protein
MYKSAIIICIVLVAVVFSCKHEPPLVNGAPPGITPPPPGAATICFATKVLPIFVAKCATSGCHDPITHQKGLILNNYNAIMKGIKGNDPGDSEYWEKIISSKKSEVMPPPQSDPLTKAEMNIIYGWIMQGATETPNCKVDCDPLQFSYSVTITSILNGYGCTSANCHSGTSPGAGLNLTDYQTVKNITLNGRLLGAIRKEPNYKPMPPAGAVDTCNIRQIINWKNAGAPQN